MNYSKERKIPKHVEDALPLKGTYADGIMLLDNGKYSKTFRFSDANYTLLSKEDKENVFMKYQELLNLFDSTATTKITLLNRKISDIEFDMKHKLKPQRDGLDFFREEYNDNIERVKKSINKNVNEKYITITIERKNLSEARAYFLRAYSELSQAFKKIGSELYELNESEKLRLIKESLTYQSSDYLEILEPNDDNIHKTLKYICPQSIEYKTDYAIIDGRFFRSLYLKDYANFIKDSFIQDLLSADDTCILSIDAEPISMEKAIKQGENKLMAVETNITNWVRKQNSSNLPSSILPYDMQKQREESREFLNDLVSRDQRMIPTLISVLISADTKDELDLNTEKIINCSRKHLCNFSTLRFQQLEGINTTIPFGKAEIKIRRTLTTESLGVFMPFDVKEVSHPDGIFVGVNKVSRNIISVNRESLQNGNAFILGVSGSGKSMMSKCQIFSEYLNSDCDVIIIDPESEYGRLVNALGGENIVISSTSENHINVMDMSRDYADGTNPIALKSEYILSLFEELNGNLGPTEKSIIDRVTQITYKDYLRDKCTGEVPTLNDFRLELLKQPEKEASDLALTLELFTSGSLNVFSKETNVNTNSRLICFDIKDLGKQLMPLGMLAVLDNILNRITTNRKEGRKTFIFIDEIYLLLRHEYSCEFLYTMWKRVRKYGAYITGITQNVEDLLVSETSRTMLSNSELVFMFNQASSDREKLGSLFNISAIQMGYLTDALAGNGLIRVGSAIIPFENSIDEDSRMFKLMTTKVTSGRENT